MIHSARFTAVLDACVLYPAPIRDPLLHLASFELYTPKWTDRIHEEWRRNLLLKRLDLRPEQLDRTVQEMKKAFPDAGVEKYESLITSLQLPDEDDRHILAAAIRCKTDVIVTFNLKDFPSKAIEHFDIEAQHPDLFISNLIDLNPEKSVEAFLKQVSFLRNPPKSELQVLDTLKNCGLDAATSKLAEKLKLSL
ncbi:MAG TPA: PIN domain-containing protein [Ohtaekwangia sp.]|uniref:PIN domain-containing protein n=1 Tax=Ohtaekwangia sp. TaxID=2066019 RepID=UPI002F951B99